MNQTRLSPFAILLLAPLAALQAAPPAVPPRPNIVILLADDLGYGDVGCYGATKIKTPRMDGLAEEGVRFTDAHSVAAVCNPSRYSILSGTYLWHAKRKNDYSLYFHDGQVTLPALLKSAGYRTAALGKWHNGFGRNGDPDWNGELKPGPLEIGFDYFFGTPRTHNEPPLVFVENHRVVGLDPADPIRIDKTKGPHGEMLGGARPRPRAPTSRSISSWPRRRRRFSRSKRRTRRSFCTWRLPHRTCRSIRRRSSAARARSACTATTSSNSTIARGGSSTRSTNTAWRRTRS